MTYQTNIPNSSQSPGLFPSQSGENFTRLKTIIGANHKFNDSTATDDGYHQIIKSLPVAAASVGNDNTIGQTFVNSDDATNQLWHKDGSNNVYQITPTIPIRAAINFTVTAGVVTVNYSMNCTVVRTGQGQYTLTFTAALPSTNYMMVGNCQGRSPKFALLLAQSNSAAKTTSNLSINTIETSNTATSEDPQTCYVAIMGG